MRGILLALLAAAALLAPPPRAGHADEADAAARLRRTPVRTWYGVYLGGTKVGWAERASGPVVRHGRPRLRIARRVHLRFRTDGELRETRIEREKIFLPTAPYRLVAGLSEVRRGARGKRVKLRTEGGRLVADVTTAGQTRTLPVEAPPTTFDEELRAEAVARAAPEAATTLTTRTFDLAALETHAATVTLAPQDGGLAGVARAAGERDLVRYDREGRLVHLRTAGLLELRREPRATALALPPPADALAGRLAQVDQPLGAPDRVEALVLRARGPGVERLRAGPRQDVLHDPATRTVTLRLGAAAGPAPRATPAAVRAALAETPAHPIRHRLVRTLAEEIAATGATPRARVERLLAFVADFVLDTRDTATLTTLEILARQEGDCTKHALLFTTLARAAGIPAREVVGVVYRGDEDRRFGWHAWAEVVLDGRWVPVDPMHAQLPADATHIREGLSGTDRARFALADAALQVVSLRARPAPRRGYDILDEE